MICIDCNTNYSKMQTISAILSKKEAEQMSYRSVKTKKDGVWIMNKKKWIIIGALMFVILVCLIGWYVQSTGDAKNKQPDMSNSPDTGITEPGAEDTSVILPSVNTVEITRPDMMIYTGPGYDYSDTGTLLAMGSCTITEEETDREGIPWGLLATGEGWIDLQKAAAEAPHIPLTMELDCSGKLTGREYHEHIITESEYLQRLLFRAYEPLTNIRFTMMDITADGIISGEPLYTLESLTPDKALVIGVVFFGDLTTYGLFFTDASGVDHYYMLYTSGRNGSVVMQAYTPK